MRHEDDKLHARAIFFFHLFCKACPCMELTCLLACTMQMRSITSKTCVQFTGQPIDSAFLAIQQCWLLLAFLTYFACPNLLCLQNASTDQKPPTCHCIAAPAGSI